MDILSEVLRAVRMTGAVYFDVRARQPWVAESPPLSQIRAEVMPEFEHVIAFHMMLDGWCWAQLCAAMALPAQMMVAPGLLNVAVGGVRGLERGHERPRLLDHHAAVEIAMHDQQR